MKFKDAYNYAIQHSKTFREHDKRVKESIKGVLIFSVYPTGETFYYGFDGVDILKGKHSPRRSAQLINRSEVLIIL